MIKERPCIKVTAEELQAFEEYHSFLWRKVRLKDNPYRKEITQGLLLALFYEIYDIYQGTQRRNVPRKAVRRICLSTSSGMYPRAIKKSGVWPIMPARCFSRPSTFLP